MNEPIVRRRWLYRGRVQGVGFRATVRDAAGRFRVVGFVQNLSDGRVLVSAEGTADELTRFAAAVAAEMERCIAGVDVEESPPGGDYVGFTIRR